MNVLVPAHYLIPFSRVGAYDRKLLDGVIYRSGQFAEVMAHEASIVPIQHWPLVRQACASLDRRSRVFSEYMATRTAYAERVLDAVRAEGPISSDDAPDPGEPEARDRWGWGLNVAKISLDLHYLQGRLAIVERRADYSRVYDLVERVIPPEHYGRNVSGAVAQRELILLSARSLGIGTAADIADYYRLPVRVAKRCLAELVAEGEVTEMRVEGWRDIAFLHSQAHAEDIDARALLSPFDPVVWFRPRAERLFRFDYRIEIYLPKDKRRWGYYVLPFLLGDRLVARVDLKADRAAGKLLVAAAYVERGVRPADVAEALALELSAVGRWLGLEAGIEVSARGNLSRPLRGAILAPRAR